MRRLFLRNNVERRGAEDAEENNKISPQSLLPCVPLKKPSLYTAIFLLHIACVKWINKILALLQSAVAKLETFLILWLMSPLVNKKW